MEEAGVSLKETYDRDFYHGQSKGSARAAQLILPYVLQAVGSPRTVLDIGCGVGTWLRVLQDLIPDVKILGVDHPDVPQDLLMISKDEFVGMDLRKEINLGSRFELVMSLEVAEHIDNKYAGVFINNLTRHSDRILFSAAIPGQRGDDHVNERWPSFWIDLFAQQGFFCNDFIRPEIWDNAKISFWYRQNTMLFTSARLTLRGEHRSFGGANLAHPELLARSVRRQDSAKEALRALRQAILRNLRLVR